MNLQHWILAGLWILYCVVHSFLADASVKIFMAKVFGKRFRYYRISYSIFAFATLAAILLYQFSISSYFLFTQKIVKYSIGILLVLPGMYIMSVCIGKYFYELSGVQALENKIQTNTLQQSGLHRFVRHPLYFGTLLFVWGLFILFPLLSNLIACIIIHGYVLAGIQLEEKKLIIEYGEAYKNYAAKVPKLFPVILRVGKK